MDNKDHDGTTLDTDLDAEDVEAAIAHITTATHTYEIYKNSR
jgi:hypothetical protein